MAEFVSAIVALAAAGAQVGCSLYSLIHTLKDAPNEFLALSDEITDFRSILSRLLDTVESEDFLDIGADQVEDLNVVRQRGEQIVAEIETLVMKVSKEDISGSNYGQVKKIRWLRHAGKAAKLKERLRTQKATICNVISLAIIKSSARNGLRILQLEMKVDRAVKHQALLMERHFDTLLGVNGSFKQPLQIAERREILTTTIQAGNASFKNDKLLAQSHPPAMKQAAGRSQALRCLEDCPCRCHFRTVVRSPRFMADWFGDFFLGCANLPWSFSGLTACTEQTCRRSLHATSDIRYFLPSWTNEVVRNFTMKFNLRCPPIYINVHSRRTIPYDSPILICVQEGDVKGARKLLISGDASINDVDPYGLGLLYYAAYYCWRSFGHDAAVGMCQFLLDMGASRDWDDEIGNTPKETMIDNTLVSLAMTHSSVAIRATDTFVHISELFGQSTAGLIEDFVDDRGLSTLHQVLLGIDSSHGTLDEYLIGLGQRPLPPEIIDAPDSCGRSALAWAVEYMWHDAAKTLLEYGADPRQSRPSLRGSLPLLHLVIACPVMDEAEEQLVDTVRLLLHHGADVNGLDHEGWTPLHVASSWNNAAVIKELFFFSNGELDWDALTVDNQSAIDLALGAGFDAEVQNILQCRGDVDSDADEFFDCSEKALLN